MNFGANFGANSKINREGRNSDKRLFVLQEGQVGRSQDDMQYERECQACLRAQRGRPGNCPPRKKVLSADVCAHVKQQLILPVPVLVAFLFERLYDQERKVSSEMTSITAN